jgi:hypothetical protein
LLPLYDIISRREGADKWHLMHHIIHIVKYGIDARHLFTAPLDTRCMFYTDDAMGLCTEWEALPQEIYFGKLM